MFKEIDDSQKSRLLDYGYISYRNATNIIISTRSYVSNVKHLAEFKSRKAASIPIGLFEFDLSILESLLVIKSLRRQEESKSSLQMDEPSLHFFIGLFIKSVPIWASKFNKENIVIETNLPHCTQYFAQYDYVISKVIGAKEEFYRGVRYGRRDND